MQDGPRLHRQRCVKRSEVDRTLAPGEVRANVAGPVLCSGILFFSASIDHPFLKDVVKGMQKHGTIYCEAIDMSIQTAQDGHTFSADAIDLCDFLLDPDIKRDELREYILGMQNTAKRVRHDSTKTLANFRLVHIGLMEVRSGYAYAFALWAALADQFFDPR